MSTSVPFRLSLLDIDDSLDVPQIRSVGYIICLGTYVPKDIRTHITKFHPKKSPKILEKYYGKHWNRLLQLVENKKGGDDNEEFEDSLFEDLTLDELMEMETEVSKKSRSTIKKQVQLKEKINYNFDIDFYLEDDIQTVKEKISIITDIPYYKQHVSYETSNYQYYSTVGYEMEIDQDSYNIQLQQIDFSKMDSMLMGIPIDRYLYSSYESAYIKLNETTTPLSYYNDIDSFGTFSVISIDSFLKDDDIKKKINHLIKIDKEQYYLIYHSFVYKYFPTFTESVFLGYIKNEEELHDVFPDLIPSTTSISKKINLEKEIFHNLATIQKDSKEKYEAKFRTKINKLAIQSNDIYSDDILNIRTLFNNIQLSTIKNVNFIESILNVHGKNISVRKINTIQSAPYSHSYTDKQHLFLSIYLIEEEYDIFSFLNLFINMTISTKGVITVYIQFPQSVILNKKQCIHLIIKKVNPIIQHLNTIKIAFNSSYRILPLEKNNFKYMDSSISLIYNDMISFNELKNLFEMLVDADIFRHKSSVEENEYLLHKGITSYSMNRLNSMYYDTQNHYAYLSDLQTKYTWIHLFSNKTIVIKYNVINTVFEINNITMNENKYVKLILYKILMFYQKKLQPKANESLRTNNINSLKHTDPKLFNFKAKSNYSRVCQKKFQPVLTSLEDIRKNKIKHAVKYWNFTKNKEEYYYCPYKQNKFIGFITEVHPNNYCLPCCKKIQKEDEKYTSCLKDGTYTKTSKKGEEEDSENRYILQYAADIRFENRITELPNSLQKILNEQFNQKLYVYGYLYHSIQNIPNMSILFIYMDIMDMSLQEYILMIVKYLRENEDIFPFLLNGAIYEYYSTTLELCKDITHTFTQTKLMRIPSPINWNDLFRDIMYHYGLNTIIFEDVDASFNKERIELVLSPTQYSIQSVMKNDKSILVIREKNVTNNQYTYYPIYTINKNTYFSDGNIESKIIESANAIHKTMINILEIHFTESDQEYRKLFTLENLIQFIQSQKIFILRDLYIDTTKCYAVGIVKNPQTYIYLSITHSSLELIDTNAYNFIYTPVQLKKYSLIPKNVFEFISEYNKFVYQKTFTMLPQEVFQTQFRSYQKYNQLHYRSEKNIHIFDIDYFPFVCNPIHITEFIIHKKMVIGCIYGTMYTYFQPPISIKSCISIIQSNIKSIQKNIMCKTEKETKQLMLRTLLCTNSSYRYILQKSVKHELKDYYHFFREFLYHPHSIHQQLLSKKNNTYLTKSRLSLFNSSMYTRYIYKIFIYLFTHSIKLHQNKDIRSSMLKTCKSFKLEQLLSIINRNTNRYSKMLYDSILNQLLKKYKIDLDILNDIALSSYNEFINLLNLNKTEIIYNYKNLENVVKTLLINNDFMFDMIHIEEIKHLSLEKLKTMIEKYTNKHIHIQENIKQPHKLELHEEEFINKNSKNMFYTNKKLNISKQKYKELIDILAYDITNPFKQKYILSNLFFDSPLVDTIYFKQYENEKIFINYL